ncbi:family A G protein-coupled receptor-like protein [Rhizoclosmatium globosum]|uniref:Family A G protein-coupled receptor-like protein n=1 Tax=Rhizoclosmatium globosum TaxID=329046 RepID=A0A1Y2CD55_9FUNG|nr:family A G protein-coupled receptor-like protein [Rhizoclosmatium globosum]|eukprot:ORY44837.1 family A G protein-coupled receptor-like protein [Rhizoclosmatium globosum]
MMDNSEELVYAILFGTTSVIAVLLNFLLILCSISKAHKLQPSSFLSFCLCCSDGFNSTINVIVTAMNLFVADGGASPKCHILGFLSYTGHAISLILVLSLTLCRYLYVLRQQHVTHRFARRCAYISVVVAIMCCVMPLVLSPLNENNYTPSTSRVACGADWSARNPKGRIITSIFMSVMLLPVSFILFAYWHIYITMSKSITEMKVALSNHVENGSRQSGKVMVAGETESVTVLKSATEMGAMKQALKLEEEQNSLLLQSVLICVSFVTGWITYVCMILYEAITGNQSSPMFDFVATYLIVCNEIAGPLIILRFNKEIQANLAGFFQ